MLDPIIVYSVDFCLIVTGIIISLFYGISNLLKKRRYLIHILFSIISFTIALLCTALLYQLLFRDSEYFTLITRIYFVFILLSIQLFLHLHQAFPRWEMRLPKLLIIATSLPGIALSVFTILTDSIITEAVYSDYLYFEAGNFFYIFPAAIMLYTIGSLFILNYRRFHMENDSYRTQVTHLMIAIAIPTFILLVPAFFLPYLLDIHDFTNWGILTSFIVLLFINNYAISDNSVLDYKSFYLSGAYWLTITAIIFIPAAFLLTNIHVVTFLGINIHPALIALFILFYFVSVFSTARFVYASLMKYIVKSYNHKVHKLFSEIEFGINDKREDEYWNILLANTMNGLKSELKIESATLFIYNSEKNKLTYCYSIGNRYKAKGMKEVINIAKLYPTVIYKPEIFINEKYQKHSQQLRKFFADYGAQAMLPLFNNRKELSGLLLLGFLHGKKTYSYTLRTALELYRRRLEFFFSNALRYEEITSSSVSEQKTVSVKAVKKHILPKKLTKIKGISLSSLYLNYSSTGGNFFTSLSPSDDNLCICISDLDNRGRTSAIRAIELYAALSVQNKQYASSEQLLNRINWVLATSRFAENQVRFFSMNYNNSRHEINYSNAALNPLVLYSSTEGSFSDYDTRGIPLGEKNDYSYTAATLSVNPNDIGILFTDGITRATDSKNNPYGIGRIKEVIESNLNETTAGIVKKIYNDFKLFTGDVTLTNDASLILFRIS